ncbi:MAG: THxN family PEP-CTERM protein [Calothrix sp. MO_167.B42]|nr:THxN family PEP-CTERM protein [Calothrix sp. MO_167.B42]
MTTSGTWTSADTKSGSQNAVSGLGTNEISWGTPTIDDKQSSYLFEGVDTSLGLDGENYLLGTFTHKNYPITDDTLTEANLALDLDIGGSFQTLDLVFKHDETPNTAGPNNSGYVDDIVSIPSVDSTELLEIDGEMYKLVVSGFYQDDHLTSEFITEENKSNSAEIYGRLEKVEDKKTVPEPAAGLGLLAIGAIGTFKVKKKLS